MLKLPELKGHFKLPRLPKLATLGDVERLPRKVPNELKTEDEPFSQKYAPYPPFNSSYEVYIWQWLNKSGNQTLHQWQTQITFGRKSARGSTRVDFLSRVLMIAWYPDGTYWHVGNGKEAADDFKRAQVAARGFRVVQWLLSSSEELVRDLPTFYRDMVYRGRNR